MNSFVAWWMEATVTWVPWLLVAIVATWLISVIAYHVQRRVHG